MKTIFCTLLLICLSVYVQATIMYVNVNATGANNGTSWADAYTHFESTHNWMDVRDTIWVAKGIYQPQPGSVFELIETKKYFGGFEGWETALSQRNWKQNVTILQGNGSAVFAPYNVGLTHACVLDGFTVSGGTMVGSGGGFHMVNVSPIIRNCTITGNAANSSGGGIYCNGGSPLIINCIISGNTSSSTGGGLYFIHASPVLINCLITGNSTTTPSSGGGAHVSFFVDATFINCTIAGNWSSTGTGGIRVSNGSAITIRNCIVAHNTGNQIGAIAPSAIYITNTIGFAGGSNFDMDPQFVSPIVADPVPNAGGDFHLQACSPAITAGDNTAISETTDLDNLPRIQNTTVDIGAYEYQGLPGAGSVVTGNANVFKTVFDGTTVLTAPNTCSVIATVLPTGGSTALAGDINARVWMEGSVPSYNSQYYVQRHYDIQSVNNAATSTATVTLYFTQAEFDAFNAVSTVKLPVNPTDAAGMGNLYISQFQGTSPSGTPGTYSGNTVTIVPALTDIVWNSTLNAWQVSFPVTGSGGFAVMASATLPLHLIDITGQWQTDNTVVLKWKTADEQNTAFFEVLRSRDGNTFISAGKVAAKGTGNNSYTFTDKQQAGGYYRLKMADMDGRFTYSKTIRVSKGGIVQKTMVSVNPVNDAVILTIGSNQLLNTKALLVDVNGHLLQSILIINNSQRISLGAYAPGIYFLKMENGEIIRLLKR